MSGEESVDHERFDDQRDPDAPPKVRRIPRSQIPVAFALTVVWVLLWGELNAFNVVGGLLVAGGVLLFFPLPPIEQPIHLRPLGLLWLGARFGFDVLVASAQVAAAALRFGYQPMNALIEVPLRSRSDLFLTFTAELVSLVPGSLLIEVDQDRHVIYLHIFGVRDLADVEKAREDALAQERRVVEALANDADLAAYHRAVEEERS